jgi:hypothetical protein
MYFKVKAILKKQSLPENILGVSIMLPNALFKSSTVCLTFKSVLDKPTEFGSSFVQLAHLYYLQINDENNVSLAVFLSIININYRINN